MKDIPCPGFQRRSAFTLIELLVVIAIIAILAAILFPVFASAKEAAKKTSSLSNAKQCGTSMQLYLNDYDDMYPRSVLYMRFSGGWLGGIVFPFPSTSVTAGVYAQDDVRQSSAETYPNSAEPYTKNLSIQAQGPQDIVIPGFTLAANAGRSGLPMNGFFSNLSASVVQAPSSAVVLWGGQGDGNYVGFACNTPAVEGCGSEDPTCSWSTGYAIYNVYRPNPAWNRSVGPWTYTKGVAIVRADGSAKWQRIANQVNKDNKGPFNTAVWQDPFSAVYKNATGWQGQFFRCNTVEGNGYDASSTAGMWPCYFRPDRIQ